MTLKFIAAIAVLALTGACMGSTEDDTTNEPSTPSQPTQPQEPATPATTIIAVDTTIATNLNAGPTSTSDVIAAFDQINGGLASDPPAPGVASFSGSFAFVGVSDSDNATLRTFDGNLDITFRPEFSTQDQYLATLGFENVTDAGGTAVSFDITENVLSGRMGEAGGLFQQIAFNDPVSGTVDGQPWELGLTMTGQFANDGQDGLGRIIGIGGSNDVEGVFSFSQD